MLLSANVAENHSEVAANLDARENRLESLYADYWRTEYKIAMGEQKISRHGPFKNRFVPLSRTIIFFESLITRAFPTGS